MHLAIWQHRLNDQDSGRVYPEYVSRDFFSSLPSLFAGWLPLLSGSQPLFRRSRYEEKVKRSHVAAMSTLLLFVALTLWGAPRAAHAGVEWLPAGAVQVPGSTTQGTLLETSFPSPALGIAPPLRIYLPPGYETSGQRYPVLYLLHGNAPDSDWTEWSAHMRIDFTAGSMIASGQIAPMIIVMPYGLHSYWMNLPGGLRWADYITSDLVPYIDANYRTVPDAAHRAIGGNSMGGTAALHFSFNHPDLFGIVGSHSPALRVGPDEVITDWNSYTPYDPLHLAETAPNLQTLQIWLDVGDQDPWRGNAGGLHERLVARDIAHSWNMFPGSHDPSYWIAHSPDYLRFYSGAFQKSSSSPAPAATNVSRPAAATPTPPPVMTDGPKLPRFTLGFKTLADAIPNVVGQSLEDEHYAANGDSLQRTTTGLMVWRKADNWTAFTDGSRTWVNGPYGIMVRGNDERFDWESS